MPWLVVATAAAFAAGLAFAVLRRRPRLGALAAALVLGWTLVPYRFDGEHAAPALVVGLFRLLFEDDASPRGPLLLLAAVTVGVLALAAAGFGLAALFDVRAPGRQRQRRRHGRMRNPKGRTKGGLRAD